PADVELSVTDDDMDGTDENEESPTSKFVSQNRSISPDSVDSFQSAHSHISDSGPSAFFHAAVTFSYFC
ncbi:MAG: hypothetical protein ACKO96_38755, partial [Flammeovirgaceae bacterium]